MPVEQRVVTRQKIGGKIGEKAAPEPTKVAEPEKAPRRGRTVLVAVVVAVVVAAGVAAFFLLGPGGAGATAEPTEPPREPGEVLQVEPVSINLADGHYLRLGLGLQLTTEAAGHAPDPSRALDLAIALYSGRPMGEVTDPATRDSLKSELARQLDEAYDGEVMDVYLTTYVTQ